MTSKIENCFLKVIETISKSAALPGFQLFIGFRVFFFLFLEDAINY